MPPKQRRPISAGETGAGTRERILAAAEELFAIYGTDGVSYRQLTAKAGVNVAAVNYHFGTKAALLGEIFTRHAEPIAARRLELLARCKEVSGRRPMLEQVIEAFLVPAFDVSGTPGGISFMQLRARLSHTRDDFVRELFYRHFDHVSRKYLEALGQLLPHLPEEELYWRFHFFLGSYIYTMSNPGRIQKLSEGRCDPGDLGRALHYLVPYAASGFLAPSVKPRRRPRAAASADAGHPVAAGKRRRAGSARAAAGS